MEWLLNNYLPMAVGKSCATGGGRIRGRCVLRRCRGRNGGGFVVLRGQSSVVDFVLGGMSFGRTFDVHERHRARHRALARLLLGAPRQQLDTLDAAISAIKETKLLIYLRSYIRFIQQNWQFPSITLKRTFYCFHAPLRFSFPPAWHSINFLHFQEGFGTT